MKILARLFLLTAFPASLLACVLEDEPPRRLTPQPYDQTPSAPGAPSGSTSAPSGPGSSSSPMLVTVDTDQTMTVKAGEGVGVFVEYAAGGNWSVRWACDTSLTRQACDYVVGVTAQTGNIGSVDTSGVQGGTVTNTTPSRLEARITTRTEIHGVTFTTAPGSIVTVEASVGGVKDGAFLFFVQDGKVNGGYQGKLTNPLQLQGDKP